MGAKQADESTARVWVEVVRDDLAGFVERMPALQGAGLGGLIVVLGADRDIPPAITALVRAAVETLGGASVLLAGDPAAARAVGAGVLVAERGPATAEVRRVLGSGVVAREIGSVATARAAVGDDLLVVDGDVPLVRQVVEAAWVPVLARVGAWERVPSFVAAGAEGVVLPVTALGDDRESVVRAARDCFVDTASTTAEAPEVTVNGRVVSLLPETTVADLLADEGFSEDAVVRLNGRRLARHRYDEEMLRDGDTVEAG